MSILNNILINLYGEEFRRDFDEHLELLKEINEYYRRKRVEIEKVSKDEFLYLANTLRYKYSVMAVYLDNDDRYWSYSEWFKEVFIEEYDKALIEVEQQTIPSNRELCILRLAREAAQKNISIETVYMFCREYLIDGNEYTTFFIEYYNVKGYKYIIDYK